ncbi:MAG TPA: GDP-mannose 4,6-dehydratase [Nitrospira sp.]|nr:GDP-mannose 4,6-dehydratase [Nitrospira sp.]
MIAKVHQQCPSVIEGLAIIGKGYEVYGIIRRSSSFNTGRIDSIYEDPHVPHRRLHLVYGDLNDASSLNRILRTVQPDEIYNLDAQSHVRVSFDIPELDIPRSELRGMSSSKKTTSGTGIPRKPMPPMGWRRK